MNDRVGRQRRITARERAARRALSVLALVLAAAPVSGHDMNLARYALEQSGTDLVLTLTLPSTFLTDEAIEWPSACAETGRTRTAMGPLVRLRVSARCETAPTPGARILAPWGADGAVLRGPGGATTIIAARGRGVSLPVGVPGAEGSGRARSLVDVLTEYVVLGGVHILEGWDHLAFVLCLFLLARGSFLIWLVTAFTVGHSVSLALAYTGVVRIPIVPTEAVIALSIAFMAREALLRKEAVEAPGERLRAVLLVIGFGLVHGLGFASVLSDLGVASGERVAGLVAFNVGVEIGQLAFVGALACGWLLLGRTEVRAPARWTALMLAGCVGAYWFVERVAGFV